MRNITIAAILMIAPALAACGQGHLQTKSAPPPPQVTVAKPVARQIADQDEYVGRFVAVESVEVRARVSGYLEAIRFQDGQIVRKGDPLFTVDRRPFETALAQAQASLEQARANLAFAERLHPYWHRRTDCPDHALCRDGPGHLHVDSDADRRGARS